MNDNKTYRPRIAVIGLKGLPAFGGAATVGENIIRQLHDKYRFTVFSVASHAESGFVLGDVEQKIFSNFPIKKLNIFFYYLKSALYLLVKGGFDFVHLHHTDGAFVLPILKLRNKVVLTSHARPHENAKWSKAVNVFFKLNEKIAIKMADAFTVVSRPLKEAYFSEYKKSTVYIPNGVDLQLAGLLDKKIETEPYLLFAAGRIINSKGLHFLLEALRKMNYTGKLKVAGNLDQLPGYKKQILKLAVGLNVEFLGLIKEKKDLLNLVANAELFIYPTLYEAMSIMLLEAALVHTPILCSNIPANTNVFTENEVTFF